MQTVHDTYEVVGGDGGAVEVHLVRLPDHPGVWTVELRHSGGRVSHYDFPPNALGVCALSAPVGKHDVLCDVGFWLPREESPAWYRYSISRTDERPTPRQTLSHPNLAYMALVSDSTDGRDGLWYRVDAPSKAHYLGDTLLAPFPASIHNAFPDFFKRGADGNWRACFSRKDGKEDVCVVLVPADAGAGAI